MLPYAVDVQHSSLHSVQFALSRPAISRPVDQSYMAHLLLEPKGASLAEIEAAKKLVADYADMPENWDGYGALRINNVTRDNVSRALEGICRTAPVPEISPNANGTISCEWESREGYAHLEIGVTRFSFYVKPNKSASIPGDGQATDVPSEIGRCIATLLFPSDKVVSGISAISYSQSLA